MRPLLHFFLIGALLFFAKRQLTSHAAKELTVFVARDASAEEIERTIDEAVLLEHAIARGAYLSDPVVREQLLATMRVDAAVREDGDVLIDRALALGLHRADPLVRARLRLQAEQLVVAAAPSEDPRDDALIAYVAAHAARYASPSTTSLEQVFVRPNREGATLERDLRTLARALADGGASSALLGDPSLLPRKLVDASGPVLDARFGPGFAEAVRGASVGRWVGPVSSSYGLHFVRVTARAPLRIPPLAEIRARALADYRHDQRAVVLRERLRALRAQYRIHIAPGPA
jgi:hypothetical protein